MKNIYSCRASFGCKLIIIPKEHRVTNSNFSKETEYQPIKRLSFMIDDLTTRIAKLVDHIIPRFNRKLPLTQLEPAINSDSQLSFSTANIESLNTTNIRRSENKSSKNKNLTNEYQDTMDLFSPTINRTSQKEKAAQNNNEIYSKDLFSQNEIEEGKQHKMREKIRKENEMEKKKKKLELPNLLDQPPKDDKLMENLSNFNQSMIVEGSSRPSQNIGSVYDMNMDDNEVIQPFRNNKRFYKSAEIPPQPTKRTRRNRKKMFFFYNFDHFHLKIFQCLPQKHLNLELNQKKLKPRWFKSKTLETF